jgi:hypothetical protein
MVLLWFRSCCRSTDLRPITIATAQLQQSTTPGVKVTTPITDQQVPLPNNNNDDSKGLQLMGTSTDTIDTDCQVSVSQ